MSVVVPDSPIIEFLPYQKAWIADQSRFKIGMFTRRGGKTFGSCGEIVDDCVKAEMDNRKTRWTILSRSETTAKEALEDALKPMTRAYYAVLKGLSRRGQVRFEQDEFHVPAHVTEVRQGDRTYMVEVPRSPPVRTPPGGSAATCCWMNSDFTPTAGASGARPIRSRRGAVTRSG
jgi:phage FluMu gp28-like protein